MPRDTAPAEIAALADQRAAARRARDWATADALLARILAAGWRVVDIGTLYDLERVAAPDDADGDLVRYGSSASVPSRLDEPPVGPASVVLVATDWPDDLERTRSALVERSPAGTQLVVVANGPSEGQAAALAAIEARQPDAGRVVTEVVWTTVRLGSAAALNAGIRRTAAPVVVVLDASVEPRGDLVSALVAALDDPTVAVAGPFGLMSGDLRRFDPAPPGAVDVDAVDGGALAFRRSDYVARGPLDEHFATDRYLDAWWSLVLRDQAADEPDDVGGADAARADGAGAQLAGADDVPPRRAVVVATGLVERHPRRPSNVPGDEGERLARKNRYRVLKRFATRRDLLVGESESR